MPSHHSTAMLRNFAWTLAALTVAALSLHYLGAF